MLKDFRSGIRRGAGQASDIARGIRACADFIDHPAVINARSNLSTQLIFLHDVQLMIELAGNHFGLPGVIVEMLLLAGDFNVAATRKVAVDGFVTDYLLDAIDGGQRCRVHSLRELASIHGDEFVHT